MEFLKLEGITKHFSDIIAVDNVNLEVNQGDFVVLLGPSGCGKTTTLRMISGLEVQTEGKIFLDGQDISDVPAERRDMAMVFQNLALYPHMTVYENIAFCLRNKRTPADEIDKRVRVVADQVQISELLDRFPNQLSGGQRQRVALARAIIRRPKIFLLDEPLASLDAKLRSTMRSEFKLLHKRLINETGGKLGTMIYVTHDQVEALTLGTQIVVMNKGKIIQVATPKDLYYHPNHIFTATFVGSPEMNVFSGTLCRKATSAVCFEFAGVSVPTGKRGIKALDSVGDILPVTLGIRPESIHVCTNAKPANFNARVVSIEPLGQSNQVVLEVNELLFTCLVDPIMQLEDDSVVGIAFESEMIHLFDPKTGNSLLSQGDE
jgi:multiple sugar transport system ATP-binding protein